MRQVMGMTYYGAMKTATQTLRLVEMIEDATGCDPLTSPAFEWSTTKPCSKCGTVTATAVLIEDGWTPERLCVECADWGFGPC